MGMVKEAFKSIFLVIVLIALPGCYDLSAVRISNLSTSKIAFYVYVKNRISFSKPYYGETMYIYNVASGKHIDVPSRIIKQLYYVEVESDNGRIITIKRDELDKKYLKYKYGQFIVVNELKYCFVRKLKDCKYLGTDL